MKTKHLFATAFVSLFIMTLLTSCLKNDDDNVTFEAITDVYIVKKLFNGEAKYGTAFYVYANKSMSSATVTPPAGGGGEIELATTTESVYIRGKEPAESDYSTQWPAIGSYLFKAVSKDDETIQESDELEFDDMPIPHLDSIIFHSGENYLELEWETIEGAEAYVIKLRDSSNKVIFNSITLDPSSTQLHIRTNEGNWSGQVYSGETYFVQLLAFSFDSDATNADYAYNIKEVAVGESEITWGE